MRYGFKHRNLILIGCIIILLFGYSFADLQVTRTISNTVGYLNKMFFTVDGLSDSAIKVSIEGITGNINMSGDIRIGGQICLGGVCKSGFDSLWGENGTKIYYNAGNIGVGTNDPNAGVHIYKTSGGNAEIDLQSVAGAGNHWAMYHDATTNQFRIWKTVDRFFIGSGGNVGIGSNNPGYKLDISDDATAGMIRIHQNNVTRKYSGLRLDRTGNSEKWFIGMDDTTDSLIFRRGGSTNDLYINTSGNIGIGTTNPQVSLHVNGPIMVGTSSLTCSSTYAGAIRYNSTSNAMEYCNSTTWTSFTSSSGVGGNDAYTVFLGHMDDTGLTDSSLGKTSTHTVTLNGNATRSSTQSKYGGYSVYLDGNGDYLTIPDSDDWDFGTSDFTVDMWVMWKDTVRAGNSDIVGRYNAVSGIWALEFSNNNLYWYYGNGAAYTFAWTPSANTWYHIAITKASGNLRCFIDGTQIGSTVSDSNNYTASTALYIGALGSTHTDYPFPGYIDEFRISKGIARWTSTFSPVGPYN